MLKVFLEPGAVEPTCANPGEDLGYDLYALEDQVLEPGTVTKVKTGVYVAFEPSMGALVRDRSSMAVKGLIVVAGVIDAGYRGEVCVVMRNFTYPMQPYYIKKGDKVAQMIPIESKTKQRTIKVESIEALGQSSRGADGFGSTGR